MKTGLKLVLAPVGIAAILLTGCVPSKKYKASQAALQRVRDDSARLSQQVASLNSNLQSEQQKSAAIQKSLDSTSSNLATQQKSLAYYQDYFNQQKTAISQVSDQLKSAMSQAGLSGDDVQQENNIIYVRLDEAKIFKKNSVAVTTSGKQALNSLAQTIKSRSDVNVFVGNGDSSSGQGGVAVATPTPSSEGNEMAPEPRHKATHHARKSTASGAGQNQASAGKAAAGNETAGSGAQSSTKSETAVAHKKTHHKHAEGGMTYYSNVGNSHNRAWALKQGRMYTVANNFLQNGLPKVNLSLEQPSGNTNPQNGNIKVVITPAMTDFNPQSSSSMR